MTLFLHQVVAELPDEQQKMIRKARNRDGLLEGRRILVVEDDVRNVYALTNILEPRGAIVEIARNGQEALDIIGKFAEQPGLEIDLVLMDVMMPVMDVLRKGSSDTGTSNILDMMDRQMVHLIRLIDDLLDVSRVSQGKIELRREKIEVADVVSNAVEASQPLIDTQNHTLIVELSAEPLWIDADLTRLSQVLGNLLNNAAKYTPSGGEIRLSTEPEGQVINIVVSDNGVGIPAEMQSEVFDLFAQVEGHLDRSQGGLGIGLALVKRLVSMHGGTVSAKSEGAGKGSSFTVSIPLVEAPAFQPEAMSAKPQPTSTAPLKILVVDDTFEVAEAIGWMLEAINHEYTTIHDGRAAVATATRYRPDVILLDIGLPGMDGYSVCKALRENELFRDTPIIAMTGWGQDQHKTTTAEAGFTHHLVKPVSLADLETLLANLKIDNH